MPQMAPMNWLMLFIFFIMVFLSFNLMNYFIFNYKSNKKTIKSNMKKMNWKW
uniref:ATP synthase complex subunit 8 n=1 Tax=Tyraphus nitidus TaxID=2973947 RepID=A0A976YG94_9COLE|nr:ATP synthase F0 subunit 8 [Tyraphus nitidus]UVG40767.1 ATP synthase F0 subunit 8 [Tyraphus nitidus]